MASSAKTTNQLQYPAFSASFRIIRVERTFCLISKKKPFENVHTHIQAMRILVALFSLTAAPLAAQSDSVAAVDAVFAGWISSSSPGCAVGVSRAGKTIVSRAYGMANLEYGVPNTPATIFEAGSVSKQFTAAAVVLLAIDGKLSLEDPIRKYFPELPRYGDSITIRQMLNHTSGLRDWGTVAAAGGWPRGSRTYTHVHVLDIIARQKRLNYPPGSEYLYSNSNYNLAAMLVERLSGMSLPEFTRTRIFVPLGMTNTSWRDDYTRIVKNRSTAYSSVGGGAWRQDMPFENVYGNSSLLTTVGDLLKWNENFVNPVVGGTRLGRELETQGRLTSGRTISYALGLSVDSLRGVPEVSHTGATAGYRAVLARYPNEQLGVAVLCNMGSANPGGLGTRVAEIFLAGQLRPAPTQAGATVRLSPAQLESRTGIFRNRRTGEPMEFVLRDSTLALARGGRLIAVSENVFTFTPGRVEFYDDARAVRFITSGDTTLFARQAKWSPANAELAQYVGTYSSDEAETWFSVSLKDGKLRSSNRYGESVELTPVYKDGFVSSRGLLMGFERGNSGRVTGATLGLGRVRALHFVKK
jgi:CubicO group peptidase (beta-lactamase class C family)